MLKGFVVLKRFSSEANKIFSKPNLKIVEVIKSFERKADDIYVAKNVALLPQEVQSRLIGFHVMFHVS